uniref:Reverse transcriptase n=1 Tax=Cannabis sativa TaxID=3483 RepID=A0A803Q7E5_CANSA
MCKGRLFKYENMWARDPRCFWVVKEAWKKRLHSNPMINFHRKTKNTGRKLKQWNKTQFKDVKQQIDKATRELKDLETKFPDHTSLIDTAKKNLTEALLRDEIHWRQKSRVQWLSEGDMCSKFFMASTIVRRSRNYIQCLRNPNDGGWIRDQSEIANCFINYYKDLFSKQVPARMPCLNELAKSNRNEVSDKEILSPRLCSAETLTRLLLDKEKKGLIKGIKVGRQGTTIHHLMFSDDIMLFGQASIKEAKAFKECLATYCEWSGQSINLHKSSVHFSCGVPRGRIQTITEILGMKQMTDKTTYLGLPLFNTSRRTSNYNHLVDRVLQRIKGWKAKLLSSAGRACLIKSVGSTLSNYVASSDVIPSTTANKIDKALRDFWWGDTEEKRVLHCVAWETLCKPKSHGGLGFRTTEATNQAFLMKWAWKALSDDSSLWKLVMDAKYIKSHSFLDVQPKGSDSVLWKAILNARSQLNEGMCRKIGNGKSTSIWFHPWVHLGTLQPQPRLDATHGISLVSNFIQNGTWKEDLVHHWFQPEDARRTLNITLPNHPTEDSWIWIPGSNGKFTIRSAYRIIKNLHQGGTTNEKWRIVWGTKMHPRLKMLWWKILSNCLLTRGKLQLFAGINDPNCPLCSLVVEDSLHIFWNCHLARSMWFGCCWGIRTCSFNFSSWEEWISWFKISDNRPKDTSLHAFLEGAAIIFEKIWFERNQVVHHRHRTPTKIILQLIDKRLQEALQTPICGVGSMLQWMPPPEGWCICNTDVAIGKSQSVGAAIFSNHKGEITSIHSTRIQHIEPLAGEIATLCWGADRAINLGHKNIIFQSDSAEAVTAISKENKDLDKLHHNVKDIVSKFIEFSANFDLWEVSWIPRIHNSVAHNAAQRALHSQLLGSFEAPNFFGFPPSSMGDG